MQLLKAVLSVEEEEQLQKTRESKRRVGDVMTGRVAAHEDGGLSRPRAAHEGIGLDGAGSRIKTPTISSDSPGRREKSVWTGD